MSISDVSIINHLEQMSRQMDQMSVQMGEMVKHVAEVRSSNNRIEKRVDDLCVRTERLENRVDDLCVRTERLETGQERLNNEVGLIHTELAKMETNRAKEFDRIKTYIVKEIGSFKYSLSREMEDNQDDSDKRMTKVETRLDALEEQSNMRDTA